MASQVLNRPRSPYFILALCCLSVPLYTLYSIVFDSVYSVARTYGAVSLSICFAVSLSLCFAVYIYICSIQFHALQKYITLTKCGLFIINIDYSIYKLNIMVATTIFFNIYTIKFCTSLMIFFIISINTIQNSEKNIKRKSHLF